MKPPASISNLVSIPPCFVPASDLPTEIHTILDSKGRFVRHELMRGGKVIKGEGLGDDNDFTYDEETGFFCPKDFGLVVMVFNAPMEDGTCYQRVSSEAVNDYWEDYTGEEEEPSEEEIEKMMAADVGGEDRGFVSPIAIRQATWRINKVFRKVGYFGRIKSVGGEYLYLWKPSHCSQPFAR